MGIDISFLRLEEPKVKIKPTVNVKLELTYEEIKIIRGSLNDLISFVGFPNDSDVVKMYNQINKFCSRIDELKEEVAVVNEN